MSRPAIGHVGQINAKAPTLLANKALCKPFRRTGASIRSAQQTARFLNDSLGAQTPIVFVAEADFAEDLLGVFAQRRRP